MIDNDFLSVKREDLELVLIYGCSDAKSEAAWDRLRAKLEEAPRCLGCGYTKQDCDEQMDHHLCGMPTPPPPRVAIMPRRPGKSHLAAKLESLAKQVYQSWESQPGFVPWVEGGNSHKQEEARQIASRTFELALASQVGGGE